MSLKTTIQNSGITGDSYEKRLKNINFIKKLKRKGLRYKDKEKLILITTTAAGEEIYIQYPGKESRRENERKAPWDFRPKIIPKKHQLAKSNLKVNKVGDFEDIFLKDLSFNDIWEMIFELLTRYKQSKVEIAELFAIFLYRMAYMLDSKEISPGKTNAIYLTYNDDKITNVERKKENIGRRLKYSPPPLALKKLNKLVGSKIANMSIEAFLIYNDLLAWNEDCKYYYRKVEKGNNRWLNKTGRINTLLSHISVIGFSLKKINLITLVMKFVRGNGVGAATTKEIKEICKKYIEVS
jgi:hypothetical protein